VDNKAYFPYLVGGDTLKHWIQFQTGNYQIRHAEFYCAEFRLLGDRYACLLKPFNTTSWYLPFAKIKHALAMREFWGYDFAYFNALRYDGHVQSTINKRL
jgi:hypothetical protein